MKQTFLAIAIALGASGAVAQDAPLPFGSEADAEYARLLWDVMAAAKLVGPGMIHHVPYEGTDPHGMMLETFFAKATINGHEGDLVVKRNYGPAGVTADAVQADPEKHLGAYTVMFRREKGYDPENKDWFWVRYNGKGATSKTGKGLAMAGRLEKACIECHRGDEADFIFTSDHLKY